MIQLATFDCYGTLVDWEGGAAAFLYDLALRHGESEPPTGRELRDRWEAIQFELLQADYRPYRDVLALSLRAWMDERGYLWRDEEGAALLRSMRSWQPFPDTRPALTRARHAGMRLVIVSNTDRDIIAHTVRHIGVAFDAVITAEDAGAYKPAEAIFDYALERLDAPAGGILHVAFGFKYDIGPAARHGMQTAWVNRHAAPPPDDSPFDHEWRDLWPLAEPRHDTADKPDGRGDRRATRGGRDRADPGCKRAGPRWVRDHAEPRPPAAGDAAAGAGSPVRRRGPCGRRRHAARVGEPPARHAAARAGSRF